MRFYCNYFLMLQVLKKIFSTGTCTSKGMFDSDINQDFLKL